ncbi:hypothetical protein A7985_05455 [Pseudoalteromonas luteoviolacea]|uniref:Uncharacterized protein n=1 Tax=Pseudoalteromonas luteoviolacea TaxID=43657 RepID=A0A1C0TVN4_9GAMM|nr:PapB/FocB family fimbrial expression transcriptional regulator [Pseudoalteromonas luteoviolacea]OCQ23387.1 hypothetical protein A7985_05455 [Pseudoalteromonas luteoviolacea]
MKYLFKGMQSPERFELLLSLTRISSDNIIEALRDYLVRGLDKKTAAVINGIEQPNLSAALRRLEVKAELVERIKELDK